MPITKNHVKLNQMQNRNEPNTKIFYSKQKKTETTAKEKTVKCKN